MVTTASPVRRAAQTGIRHRLAAQVGNTPGRLALWMTVLVALALVTGLTAVTGIRQRAALIDDLSTRNGPLTVAAQDLYRALSDADATAASAFLSGGLEPPALRGRYEADIAESGRALTVLGAGVGDGRGADDLATINSRLPVYTGLIETARSLNRQGLPLGAAYLREASGLMDGEILPAAQRLYTDTSADLTDARDGGGAGPYLALLLCLATLVALIVVQRRLTAATNRVFNTGLLTATAAAAVLALWLAGSWIAAAGNLSQSRTDGSDQVNRLATARITALQARTDEALTLVARGGGAAFEKEYAAAMTSLIAPNGLLREIRANADPGETSRLDDAIAAAEQWDAAHRAVRAKDDGGDYPGAVTDATGDAPTSTATLFNRLDAALATAIEEDSATFAREARGAGNALRLADIGAGLLTVAMAAGIAVGVQRRRAEYR